MSNVSKNSDVQIAKPNSTIQNEIANKSKRGCPQAPIGENNKKKENQKLI